MQINDQFVFFLCFRDPIDLMLMEQHFLRSPLRLYTEMDTENNNAASFFSQAGLMEKARAHLQLWGRAAPPCSPADLHAMLLPSGPGGMPTRIPLPAHLWASSPPSPWTPTSQAATSPHGGLPPGLLGPPMHPPTQLTPPPPTTPSSSSGSPSPSSDLRLPRPMFLGQHRYSPYQIMPKRSPEQVIAAGTRN